MSRTKTIALVIGIIFALIALSITLRWCGEAVEVAHQELGPKALLKKYMWFKDASAMCDKHIADIKALKAKVKRLEEMYVGVPRKDWSRTDQEQWNLWLSEIDGIKTAYTSIAAEYNAQMAKINWAFCNAGELPEGADTPLPREYKNYSEIFKD